MRLSGSNNCITEVPATSRERRRIVIAALPDAEILDITGPAEVFHTANEQQRPGDAAGYDLQVVSASSDLRIRTGCGIGIMTRSTFRDVTGPIDTLLIAGGPERPRSGPATDDDVDILRWVRDMSRSVRRLGSTCTGTFVLATAGLLRGKRATTHWARCSRLARQFPDTRVDSESIFVRDGNIYTSAGVSAGMDLALYMVEEDLGPNVALQVARELVLYVRRSPDQSQLSTALALQIADRQRVRELQTWIAEHIAGQLSVSILADRAAMSPRNLARVFTAEVGITPARFVERIRVDTAWRRLRDSSDSLAHIARQCGFRSADSMRRSFGRVLGRSPRELREVAMHQRAS